MQDITHVLGPGVYVLRRWNRVVHVGKATKSVLSHLYAHRASRRWDNIPSWFPDQPIKFDEVFVYRCSADRLEQVFSEVCEELGWKVLEDA